ncbi:GIY-YIG nuclease family protein [Methanocaldococcus villosus]|uniref:GIY-YIG nuclease family protein n=1 Tax=Methanocaldococcus villosus TaxID=667126 RepID=UPI00035F0EF7|nr:GIY-YIG nuclease family protein [Methanocaldococcus villosus]
MKSDNLSNYGFNTWKKLSELREEDIPEKPGVYVLRLNKTFGRLIGKSDILYIGSTKNLRRRIWENYIEGGENQKGTAKRIHDYLTKKGYLNEVEVSWVIHENYREVERKLREDYENDHHELPPWNRQK